jgi:hypothetical protein
VGLASAYNLRAEIARRSGDFGLAEEDYRHSIETFYLVDPGRGTAPKLNLALVLLEKGELVEAGLNAVRIVQSVRRKTRPMFRLYALAATLPMWVVRGEFDKLGQTIQEVEAVLQELEIGSDRDLIFCLKLALEQWTEDKQGQEGLRQKMEALLAQVESGA